MPEDLDQIAAPSAEHNHLAAAAIVLQQLLQASPDRGTLPHVGVAAGQSHTPPLATGIIGPERLENAPRRRAIHVAIGAHSASALEFDLHHGAAEVVSKSSPGVWP